MPSRLSETTIKPCRQRETEHHKTDRRSVAHKSESRLKSIASIFDCSGCTKEMNANRTSFFVVFLFTIPQIGFDDRVSEYDEWRSERKNDAKQISQTKGLRNERMRTRRRGHLGMRHKTVERNVLKCAFTESNAIKILSANSFGQCGDAKPCALFLMT